tara:strand:- start:671 stop:1096 length:426 start_codon:yes stop_codon:yes gene_type:complete
VAGKRRTDGYRDIRVDGVSYKSHRIAWLLVYEAFPPNDIDHINGIRDDNRLVNLRAATSLENHRNMRLHPSNKSGFCGVCWSKTIQRWCADISVYGKNIRLGAFTDKADAIAARQAANTKYNFHPNHGMPVGADGETPALR